MGMDSTIIPLEQIARDFGVALRTLADPRWRERAGLPVVKLGGKILGVREIDLRRALRRERFGAPNGGAA